MLNIHTQLLGGRENDLQYFAILFHDLEELFTGDIPTPLKCNDDKEKEKRILLEIYKKILSLNEEEFSILKNNIQLLFKINKENECIKHHIKVIDTFDAMMFSFMQLLEGKVSFLAPFLYYINPSKEKSFIYFLSKINLTNDRYNFFNQGKIKDKDYYIFLYNELVNTSFTTEDVEKLLQFEKQQISKSDSHKTIKSKLQSIKKELEIENFDNKLQKLIQIYSSNNHYTEWISIYKNLELNEDDFRNSLLYLKNNQLQ